MLTLDQTKAILDCGFLLDKMSTSQLTTIRNDLVDKLLAKDKVLTRAYAVNQMRRLYLAMASKKPIV